MWKQRNHGKNLSEKEVHDRAQKDPSSEDNNDIEVLSSSLEHQITQDYDEYFIKWIFTAGNRLLRFLCLSNMIHEKKTWEYQQMYSN